jgi:hypothetical protein
MKAYFDETGIHDKATVITMAGLLMSGKACKELQRRWLREAAKKPTIPLPFHMTDCVVGSKRFAYLRNDEDARLEMQDRLICTLRGLEVQVYGASAILNDYKPLESILRARPELRNPWFFVFESSIQEMMDRSEASGKKHKISFVFDQQNEFEKRAHDLYAQILACPLPYRDRLGAISFASRAELVALQAIDMIVYEIGKYVSDHRLEEKPHRWQIQKLREMIPISGKLWNAEGMSLLLDELKQDQLAHNRHP